MGVKVREKIPGSGQWWVFIHHKGRRKSKKIGDKKTANSVAKKVRARLASGDLGIIKPKCPTLAEYGKAWLDSPFHTWRYSTRKEYEKAFNLHIKAALGGKNLNEIKRADIKSLVAELKTLGLSSSRLRTITGVISGIYSSAIEDEIVEMNPCQSVGKYTGYAAVNDINPLTVDEVEQLLEEARDSRDFRLYALFLLAVRSGLRIGEILALKWSDVDFEARTVEVNKSWDYSRKTMGPPKNGKPRKVDLTPMVIDALKQIRTYSKVISLDATIFTDEKGKRLGYYSIYGALREIASRPIRIHDLRHTYATLRIAKGDNILEVSKQLGHHKVAFTLDQYAHWLPGEHKDQVDELDNLAPNRTLSAP